MDDNRKFEQNQLTKDILFAFKIAIDYLENHSYDYSLKNKDKIKKLQDLSERVVKEELDFTLKSRGE